MNFSSPTVKEKIMPPHKETAMNSPYIEALMLGYLRAAFKEHLSSELVDDLFVEATHAALRAKTARDSSQPQD
ncbi:hypothetical protein [Corynebacterium striatum]|uniref:hypothetical protein n=1 Tax=Corynebacterium striatum TaxID=43770 RepID=UPI0010411241|nr:hypothetical protein [Corynebacterium striatum]